MDNGINNGINPYLKTRILTASREELQLMLYEGAIRFCRQAKEKLQKRDYDSSYQLIHRAEQIALELIRGLRPEIAPALCAKLNDIYQFLYRRLFEANVTQNAAALDDCIRVFTVLKDNWVELMQKLQTDPQTRTVLDDVAAGAAASA